MRFMQSADGKICDNSAEEIRTCPPMNRWPRLPTSLWAVGKLIFAPPPMTNALTHSPSALSPQSKCPQYRLSVGLASISMKHGQSCHMQKTSSHVCTVRQLRILLSPRHKSGRECLLRDELRQADFGHSCAAPSDIDMPRGGLVSYQIHLNATPSMQAVPSLFSGRQHCFLHEDSSGRSGQRRLVKVVTG